jgi:drug/metabolite transporter (DMT)-like permease
MFRVVFAMVLAAIAASVGQILARRGMQQIGSLENYSPLALVSYFGRALINPCVFWGTVLNAVFFFLFLAVLSWADVTVALPMTALEYGIAAVLAVLILHESVPLLRWMGIALVIIGVVLICKAGTGGGPSVVEKKAKELPGTAVTSVSVSEPATGTPADTRVAAPQQPRTDNEPS